MTDLAAFRHYLMVDRGNQPATATHIVSEVKRLEGWLEIHAPDLGVPVNWREVSGVWLTRYLHHLAGFPDEPEPVVGSLPTRVRRIAQRLKIWFEYLQQRDCSEQANPVQAVVGPKLPKHRTCSLSTVEADHLIQLVLTESRAHDRTRNWALISVMLHTDLFPAELARLREIHLGFLRGLPIQIALPDTEPATLPADAAVALQQWLLERRELLANTPSNEHENLPIWLVTAGERRGHPLHHTALRSLFRRYQAMTQRPTEHPSTVEFYPSGSNLLPSDSYTLTRNFYSERRAFMLELITQTSTLWAGSQQRRAAFVHQEVGRHLYGHALYQVSPSQLYLLKVRHEQLRKQQQELGRALRLRDASRRFQLPDWLDNVTRIEVEAVAKIMSERLRRKTLLNHYQKANVNDPRVQQLINWLSSVKDESFRVRKRFFNHYAHVYCEDDQQPTRLAIPDVGLIVTGPTTVPVYERAVDSRPERADKITLEPDFALDNTWFFCEERWEQAKAQNKRDRTAQANDPKN